jgi:hypothetical protein
MDQHPTGESFAAGSAISPAGEWRFRWNLPDGWQQGRGAFGGIVLGTLLRAMEACEPDRARRTRSLSGEIPAPVVPGEIEIAVELLRRGHGTTFLQARALQAGATVARASALLASARPSGTTRTGVTPPSFTPADDIAALPPPVGDAAPRFTRHDDYRPQPPFPFTQAAIAGAAGWVRERAARPRLDAPAIIGLLDAYWPAAFACERALRPMATLTFTAELLVDPATLDPAAPFAYRARVDGAADGFSVELRELWQDDTLVALNQQLFAILA